MGKQKCTCPKTCDCQNPPPDDWDKKEGVYLVSNLCPIHNEFPDPNPDCPICNKDTDTYCLSHS